MKHTKRRAVALGFALSLAVSGTAVAGHHDRDGKRHDRQQHDRDHDRDHDRRDGWGHWPGRDVHRRTIFVTTSADTADANPDDGRCADDRGKCSLRAAVANVADGGTVSLRKVRSVTLSAPEGDIDLVRDVKITGFGATIDLSGLGDRAFDVAEGVTASISKLTITGGAPAAGESGGAIRNAGTLHLDKVTATGNTVSGEGASGGAIFTTGTLRVSQSRLAGNTATRAGGAIEANGGTTHVDRSVLVDNATGPMPGNGGALHLTGAGVVEVTRSHVRDNTAAAEGGGLWNSAGGQMRVSWTVLVDNVAEGVEATNGGGALFNDGGTLTVEHSKVAGNSAPNGSGSGGGIFNDGGTLVVDRTTISGNDAQRAGGGVETVDGIVTIERSSLASNEIGPNPGNGGGVHVSGPAADVTITTTRVVGNTAAREGGGLWAGGGDSIMRVTRSKIANNVTRGTAADDGGAGLFNNGGLLEISDSWVHGNDATTGSSSGGGILNLGTLSVVDTILDGNAAARAGGGIESSDVAGGGDATLVGVRLTDNSTGAAPGNGGWRPRAA